MNAKDLLSPSACLDTASGQRCDATLPDNPQCTLNVHFGMMLGVDELRTEQGFHLGRSRRHQRLLHGVGVVAGYALAFDPKTFDLRITPGLAVDALGRDLALDTDQCVNLVQWWLRHQKDEDFDDLASLDDATVDLDVVACYGTCLSSPVPAIAEPCAGQASDIAYSRVCETVTLLLRRRVAPAHPPAEPLELAPGADGRIVLAKLLSERDVAPPDAIDAGDLCLPLACLRGVRFKKDAQGWTATVDHTDLSVRPLLLSTGVLQNLLLPQLASPAVQGGPLVRAGSAKVLADQITLSFDQPLAAASVKPEAFAVSEFDPVQGWRLFTVQSAVYADVAPLPPTVALTLDRAVAGVLVRITVIGTGSSPLLGQSLIPAGAPRSDREGRALTTTIHRG